MDNEFSNNMEELDPLLFFHTLCQNHDHIKRLFTHQLSYSDWCQKCNYVIKYTEDSVSLSLPVSSDVVTVNDLIKNFSSQIYNCRKMCATCTEETNHIRKMSITSVSLFIVLAFNLFSNENKSKTKGNKGFLKAVPSSKISLYNDIFTPASAIFHEGNNICNGHYYTLVRDKKSLSWIMINDSTIVKQRWPVNAKNCYILILNNTKSSIQ